MIVFLMQVLILGGHTLEPLLNLLPKSQILSSYTRSYLTFIIVDWTHYCLLQYFTSEVGIITMKTHEWAANFTLLGMRPLLLFCAYHVIQSNYQFFVNNYSSLLLLLIRYQSAYQNILELFHMFITEIIFFQTNCCCEHVVSYIFPILFVCQIILIVPNLVLQSFYNS